MTLAAGALIDIADLTDTGWVACTMESGTTEVGGHEVQVRRIGVIVFLRGRMTRAASSGTQQWCTVPAGFWPDRIVEIPLGDPADAQAPERLFAESADGGISSQGTPAGAGSVEINTSWIVAE